ncbi:class I SAM-dependent methyltransferase [Dongia soli]|uniref:SAM-dependent methyltransferase n=1 Tax=Dongia soli TaxID=600628 RepID=A0ABU5EBX9_9PROT|nr:SAM-dependent methyltransferase [Dongia soli]MDY0883888.1 SAM-dependent methyltransferase [Dongia soli]
MSATDRERDLRHQIAQQITAQGAVTVAEFMRLALAARHLGYYASRDPLGRQGDFITAPEISQMFGEMIGFWCVDTWHRLGSPSRFRLIELGPGRGTLMADALRAARLAPDFLGAFDLHLVEISQPLIATQGQALGAYHPQWHETLDTVPAGPAILIANEFFDALPIHQFEMTSSGWRERGVTLAEGSSSDDDDVAFAWTLLPCGPQLAFLRPVHQSAKPGDIAEVSPASMAICDQIARRCSADGGAALLIDYGPAKSGLGDSLQALRQHRYHDPLQDVGAADLTAHVDFAALMDVGRLAGCACFGPLTQGAFLRALGIEMRAARLSRGQGDEVASEIANALRRLIDPAEMGSLFKVSALAGPQLSDLAGFLND